MTKASPSPMYLAFARFSGGSLSDRIEMKTTPAYYIFLGVLIGAAFGAGIGVVSGNIVYGMQLGALAGMLIGWIVIGPPLQK